MNSHKHNHLFISINYYHLTNSFLKQIIFQIINPEIVLNNKMGNLNIKQLMIR